MSYVAGLIISTFVDKQIPVEEVMPMTWKSKLGYKKLTKSKKEEIIEAYGQTEGAKMVQRIRKGQTQQLLSKQYPQWTKELADDNLADAMGIAIFARGLLDERKNPTK